MNSETDFDLQKWYAGDDEVTARDALTELLVRNRETLWRKARKLCSFNPTDTEDLHAEATKQYWEKRFKYVPGDAPWIFWAVRVMCGCASDQRKKRHGQLASRMQPIGDSADWVAGNERTPDEIAFSDEFGRDVTNCLQKLEPELQQVFLLHFEAGETFKRVKEILKLDHDAAFIYYKAIRQLGDCLRSKGYEAEDFNNEK